MKPTKMFIISIIVFFSALLISCETPREKNPAIYAWFTDGTVRQISPSDGFFYQASVHPMGTHVLCSGGFSGPPHIWKADFADQQMDDDDDFGPQNAASIHAVFSWDGSKIAFASDLDTANPGSFNVEEIGIGGTPPNKDRLGEVALNIFTMDANGASYSLHRRTSGNYYKDQRPTFSPDGQFIVFVRITGYPYIDWYSPATLWIVPAQGSGVEQPIPGTQRAYRPWFSKDGKTLYFFTLNSPYGRHQIASMSINLDTTPPTYGTVRHLASDDVGLSHGPFIDPSPDRNYLYMHSNRESENSKIFNIYRIRLDSSYAIPELVMPPGFNTNISAGHATVSIEGVLTFDAEADVLPH